MEMHDLALQGFGLIYGRSMTFVTGSVHSWKRDDKKVNNVHHRETNSFCVCKSDHKHG